MIPCTRYFLKNYRYTPITYSVYYHPMVWFTLLSWKTYAQHMYWWTSYRTTNRGGSSGPNIFWLMGLLTYQYSTDLVIFYHYSTDLSLLYWPVNTLLTCQSLLTYHYSTDLLILYWRINTLLTYVQGINVLLTYQYSTDRLILYWPIHTLLTYQYSTDLLILYWGTAHVYYTYSLCDPPNNSLGDAPCIFTGWCLHRFSKSVY